MKAGNTVNSAIDASAFKNATREQWDESAAAWDDHTPQLRAWLAAATDTMLSMAGVVLGARVLDVAAGAGDQALDIARRVGPGGSVLATDLSPALVALAARNAASAGFTNVEARVADGESLGVEAAGFDAAVCRLGLMCFPDPLQGLREMRRALRPGGGVCTMVFAGPTRNPCISILMATALQHAGLPAGDPFQPGALLSLGKPGLVDELFRAAGFVDVATIAIDAPFRWPSGAHYLEFIRAAAGPIRQIVGRLERDAADAAWAEMEGRLQRFSTGDGWVGPNELLLTSARK